MFITPEFDVTAVLPYMIFGAIAIVVWVVIDMMASKTHRAEERLEEFRDPTLRKRREEGDAGQSKQGAVSKLLKKATPALAKPLQPKTEKAANKLKMRLSHAGFRSETAPSIFLGMKLVGLVIGLVASGGIFMLINGFSQSAVMRTVSVSGVLFFLPDMVLWWIARKRKEAIFLSLPDALDLMVVCVEAGLALDQAMRKVAEEMKSSYSTIADEFALCNFQLQMGSPRREVLHDLGQRTGVDDLRSLASIIIQADKFGSSIAQALRVQSDSMRLRRSQLAEEKAAKTAVQLIFPLVLFIFPGIFVVLVGPAAITVVNELLPTMGGG